MFDVHFLFFFQQNQFIVNVLQNEKNTHINIKTLYQIMFTNFILNMSLTIAIKYIINGRCEWVEWFVPCFIYEYIIYYIKPFKAINL